MLENRDRWQLEKDKLDNKPASSPGAASPSLGRHRSLRRSKRRSKHHGHHRTASTKDKIGAAFPPLEEESNSPSDHLSSESKSQRNSIDFLASPPSGHVSPSTRPTTVPTVSMV